MSITINEDLEEQRPEKQTLCQSLRRDAHVKCLILTLLILGCLAVIIWCQCAVVTRLVVNFQSFPITTRQRVSPCDEGYVYIPVAFMAMLYLVYLVECWHCSTRTELAYKVDAAAVYEHIDRMRGTQPVIWWKAICYHYVRRTRHVTRYRNGDAYTTTQVYYERINSHAAGSSFVYNHCGVKDISKKLLELEKHPATKIRFSKGFAFANLEAANEFDEQRRRFFHENERLDDYMEMCEGLDLLGVNFQEYMVAFADPGRLPWYVSHLIFWLFSIVLLSWPLRVMIQAQTAHVHYQVNKLFGVNYLTPSSGNFAIGRLSRGSTLDSSEFERHITNNNTIAPSYSEALLLDPTGRAMFVADSNGNIPNGVCPADYNLSLDTQTRENAREIVWPERRCTNRCSWAGTSRRYSIPRTGIPVSISRSSLQNGRVVYYVAPLPQDDGSVRRNPTVREDSSQTSDNPLAENQVPPPSYEDALRLSRPVYLPLRRSVTDRDIPRRLPVLEQQQRSLGEEDENPSSVETLL